MTMIHKAFPHRPIERLGVDVRGKGEIFADSPDMCGSPLVGQGSTAAEAVGRWLFQHAADFGLAITVAPAVSRREAKNLRADKPGKKRHAKSPLGAIPLAERARGVLDAIDGRVVVTRPLVEELLGAVGSCSMTFDATKKERMVEATFSEDGSILVHSFGAW